MTMNRSSRFQLLSSQFVFRFGSVFAALAFAAAWSLALSAQQPVDGPQYVDGNTLVRPANYREWMFLGSGLGMTYDASAAGTTFTNVFVNPAAYRAFMNTGRWPDKSVFVLEFRASATEAPPNTAGRFQTRLVGIEAEVKDARFPDGWAFYNFRGADRAAPLAGQDAASCVECHSKNTAVERTFVQFYPTLLEVARAKGTVKPGF
jgi:cytochrome P460